MLEGSLEDNVLTMLCWDAKHCHEIALRVAPALFATTTHRKIAEAAVAYLQRFGRPPGGHIRDLLEADLYRQESGEYFHQVFDSMEELHAELHPDYVMEQLNDFIQIRRITDIVNQAALALQDGDVDRAVELTHQVTAAQGDTKDAIGTWITDTQRWLSFYHPDDTEFFSSGIQQLDQRGVHPARGELMMMVAPSGAGKSWWLIQIGTNAVFQQRHNVLHISLENSLDVTKQRYTQTMLHLSTGEEAAHSYIKFHRNREGRFESMELKHDVVQSIQKTIRPELVRQLRPWQRRGRFLVNWFPTGTLTIEQLNSYLEMLERVEHFKPDLLILDYCDLMRIDARDLRVSTGLITRQLRGLAGTRDFALATATQGNRQSASARVVRGTMVAEDWSKMGTSDTVITYSQTKFEKEVGLARIFVEKARNSRDKWMAQVTQSYATGQFCLDSEYLADKSKVESEVKRVTGQEDEPPPAD